MARPAVILVGADKGGVGKTTVSRTLLDYLAHRKIATRAFDTECPRGTLKRFHPDITDVVDVTSVPDQMKIFDTIDSSGTQVTLIDIRAGLMSPTLQALRDIGFLDMTRWNQITFAVFHILGPSIASLDEIAETSKFLIDARYFLVKNFINNTSFFDWDQNTYNAYFKRIPHAVDLTVPKLSEMACEQVELASVPFATFMANKKANGEPAANSFVLRGYVRHWLTNVWAEYDRVRLSEVLNAQDSAPAAAHAPAAPAPAAAPAKPPAAAAPAQKDAPPASPKPAAPPAAPPVVAAPPAAAAPPAPAKEMVAAASPAKSPPPKDAPAKPTPAPVATQPNAVGAQADAKDQGAKPRQPAKVPEPS
jgi:hypothetical protein